MPQKIIYTETDIRYFSNIAISAFNKYLKWEFEYNTEIKLAQKNKINRLQ